MREKKHVLKGTFLTAGTLCISAGMAWAQPASLKWSSFAHTGPGDAYPVVAEIEHDSNVQVEGASGRWRRIRLGPTVGWIDAEALSLPRPSPHGAPRAGATCVDAGLTGWVHPTPDRYCLTLSPAAPAR